MSELDPVMIRTVSLGRRFGSLWAIRDMDLEVRRGEVLGLVGPNGAGKTTTVRVLTALIAPTEGRASVDGLDVQAHPDEVRARVGILTETPGLYVRSRGDPHPLALSSAVAAFLPSCWPIRIGQRGVSSPDG